MRTALAASIATKANVPMDVVWGMKTIVHATMKVGQEPVTLRLIHVPCRLCVAVKTTHVASSYRRTARPLSKVSGAASIRIRVDSFARKTLIVKLACTAMAMGVA